jgi:hypothetical protein
MYPDLSHRRTNVTQQGKVFDTYVASSGIGVQSRTFSIKPEAWQECTRCPEYRFCYDLSLATLLLGGVLEHSGTAPSV